MIFGVKEKSIIYDLYNILLAIATNIPQRLKTGFVVQGHLWGSLSLRRHAHGPLAKRLMHTAHLSGNTSVVSKSSLDWLNLYRISGRRVSRSLKFRLELYANPLTKEKVVVFTTVTTSAYQDQLNAWFSKVCQIFKVHGIESLKYVREFNTPVCYCGDISTPRNVTLNKTNSD